MTYLHLYIAALYTALEKGGKQEDVERAIAEVNNPSPAAFQAWLKAAGTVACGVCGNPFTPPENVELNTEALCLDCPNEKKKSNLS